MNLERFKLMSKEEKDKLNISDFTVSEIKYIIEETVFAKEIDIEIAILRFTKNMTQERIAEKVGYSRNAIQARLLDIECRLKMTLKKIL